MTKSWVSVFFPCLFIFLSPVRGIASDNPAGEPLKIHHYIVLSASEGVESLFTEIENKALPDIEGVCFRISWRQFTSDMDTAAWDALRACLDACNAHGWTCIPVIDLDPQFVDLTDPSRIAGLKKQFHFLKDHSHGTYPEQITFSLDTDSGFVIPAQNPNLTKSFRRHLQRRYHDLEHLNQSWQGDFTSWAQIDPGSLDTHSPQSRRDLSTWQKEILKDCINACFAEARRQFPRSHLNLRIRAGLDANVLMDVAARWKAAIQIVCDKDNYGMQFAATRPLLTAARVHGVNCRLVLTTPVDAQVLKRACYISASSGIRDLIHEIDVTRPNSAVSRIPLDPIPQPTRVTTGEIRVAVLATLPSPEFQMLMAQLRDITDFDCLDEESILHGALKHYDVLISLDAVSVPRNVLKKIERFALSGGVVFHAGFTGLLTDLSGTDREFVRLFKCDTIGPKQTGHPTEMDRRQASEILSAGLKRVRHGTTVLYPAHQGDFPAYLEFLRLCLFGHIRIADFIPLKDPGDVYEGLYWTQTGEHAILYFNESGKDREILIYPAGRAHRLIIPAGEIVESEY